jgi:hypothetical protein
MRICFWEQDGIRYNVSAEQNIRDRLIHSFLVIISPFFLRLSFIHDNNIHYNAVLPLTISCVILRRFDIRRCGTGFPILSHRLAVSKAAACPPDARWACPRLPQLCSGQVRSRLDFGELSRVVSMSKHWGGAVTCAVVLIKLPH